MEEPEQEGLDAALARLVSDSRAEEAARQRIRTRNLRAAALTDATFAGVIVDLAERGEVVSIRTAHGRTLTGRVVLTARDAIAVETGAAGTTYVRLDGVTSVRRMPGVRADPPSGGRCPPRQTSLAALLAELAQERPRVTVALQGEPSLVVGELRGAGVDVLTLRLDGEPPVMAYLAVGQVSDVTVLASG